MTHATPLLDAALDYASRGWLVLPLHTPVKTGCSCGHADCTSIGKHPRYHQEDLAHGLKDATTNPDHIRRWWTRWRNANVGIVTGAASGLVVIDIDPRHGGDLTRDDLQAEHGRFPDTVESLTGGGGQHLFYQHPGEAVACGTDALGPGVDIKADGGYVVAPPSLHASGQRYEWEISSHPDDVALAPLPAWFPRHQETHEPPAAASHATNGQPREGSPGDDFNRRASPEDVRALLTAHGWVVVEHRDSVDYLRRPGKAGRVYSGTLGKVAPNGFYCFTTNGQPFQVRHGYKPFSVYGLLEHQGDFKAAAQALAAQGYGERRNGHHPPGGGEAPPDGREVAEPKHPPIHLTDRGNALRLIKAHGRDLHYIYRWKKWLVWEGTRWVVDEGHRVEALAKGVIVQLYAEAQAIIDRLSAEVGAEGGEEAQSRRAQQLEIASAMLKWALKSESAERLSGMLKQARSEQGIAITPDQLDADPWLLNCPNGSLDLRTGSLHPHRREDLCTKRLDVAYDPQARCPQWEAFLWRIMGGPKPDEAGPEAVLKDRRERAARLITYLQRAAGYSLTGVIREQVLQFMYGSGDNGKTTFSETLAALMGDYFQKAPQELLMRKAHQQSGGPSPEIARLCGVRLVIASEVDAKHRLNEAQVKDLTGDDTLTARGLYEDYVQFKPTHKLWMYGNHKPVIVGTDDAIWKRPKLIPFTEKIPKAEQQADLRETALLPELPGILAWAVKGCLAWQHDGLQEPPEVQAETQKYRNEMDLVAGFIQERCEADRLSCTRGLTLHAAYVVYTEGDKEAHLSARKFYERLRERGYDSYPGTDNKTVVIGLKLKPTTADEAEAWN